MSNASNIFMLTGHTGKKLTKVIQGEKTFVYVSLAVKRNFKNSMGEYETDWVNLVAYNKVADYLDGLEAGSLLSVLGYISSFKKIKDNQVTQDQSLVIEQFNILNRKGAKS
ncbi:single-stranded DNA-binding protein [Bacillus safensis]|uniref:Single-stranded DNA-binding protein n=1 Tax=Bacillus safensis TaxID=561879 RepID=A0A1L6ZPD2_BACIA|nr:single-stranded DNA-binding protein [Bacillus safensis]APT48362.1 hypothetical protein BSA145_21090 [Bacillus safensis]